jgi:tetratricopeptide (TPR) repeat protein
VTESGGNTPQASDGAAGVSGESSDVRRGAALEDAREYYRLAMLGDIAAIDMADGAVERLLAEGTGRAEALAIRGGLLTLRAKLTHSFPKRLYYFYKAIKSLNRAVEEEPENPAARTIRGFTSLVLPGFLRRLKVAAEDFEYLIRRYEEDPSFLPDEMMPKIYLNLGIAYAKEGKRDRARKSLAEVTERFPGSGESERAQSVLARLARRS